MCVLLLDPAAFVDHWHPGIDPYTGGPNSPRNASYFDSNMRPNATTGNPGRTHRFYTGTPVRLPPVALAEHPQLCLLLPLCVYADLMC